MSFRNSELYGKDDVAGHESTVTRSNSLYQAILDSIGEHVYVLDSSARILYANGAVVRALGVSHELLMGKHWREVGLPSHVMEPLERKVARVFETGEPLSGSTPFLNGGRLLPFDYDLRPVRGGDGRIQSVILTARDMSQAELALRQLQALESITDATLSDMEVEPMLQEVLLRLVSLLQSDTAAVLLLSDDGEHLTRRAAVGLERQYPETIAVPFGKGISGTIAKTAHPMVIDNLASVEVLSPVLREHVRSMAGVPLKIRGRCVGVVHVGSRGSRHYAERDVDLLVRAADRLAIALERARLHADERNSREQAERERDRLRALIDSMLDEVWACDARGRITLFNGAAMRTFGLKMSQFRDGRIEEAASAIVALRADGSPRPVAETPMLRALAGELVQEEEIIRNLQLDEDRYRYVSAAPVRDADGRITGAVASARDVTEARRVAQERERLLGEIDGQRRLMEHVLDRAPAGIVLLDARELRARWANPVYLGFLEEPYRSEGIRNARLEEFLPGAERLGLAEACRKVAQTGAPHHDPEFEYRGFSSGSTWWRFSIVPVALSGSERELMLLAVDISDQVRAKQAIDQQRQKLEVSQQKLKQAKESAERATRAKDEFLAMLSHELRNPLTPALLTVQSFEADERLPFEVRNEMAVVRRSIELEARLIDDLLDITRIVRGKLALSPCALDVHALIQTTLHVCRPDIIDKGVELSVQLQATHSWARVDGARMQQVLWNLLKNAIKFTPRGRTIRVTTSNVGDRLRIQVDDQGVGIDPELLSKIFDAFVQGPAGERHPAGGLGLGLSISRMLVEMQGGMIEAHSEGLGKGASFAVTLPVIESQSSLPVRTSAPVHQEQRPLHVLIVEDDRTTALVLTRLLRRLGHDAVSAGTVGEALAAAESRGFDLVVSDLGLPDGSGHEVMRWFADRGVRGIALSGFGAEKDLQASRDAGFSRHMVKPIDFDQLRRVISEVMR